MRYPGAALKQYEQAAVASVMAEETSPHQLIDMLLGGALDRLHGAVGCLRAGDNARKLALIASATAIVDHLRLCLDHQAGGEIAGNLDRLYDYMTRRLVQANLDNDVAGVEEVAELLRTVRSAWQDIGKPATAPRR